MYHYSSSQRNQYQSTKRLRIFQWLLLIFFIATVVLAILLSNATAFKENYRASCLKDISYEVDSALGQVNSLSRTGGSNTTSVLGKIRQHVYAAQTLVEQYTQLTNKSILPAQVFTELITTLDTFEARKLAGQSTLEQQTALTDSLTSLDNQLAILE